MEQLSLNFFKSIQDSTLKNFKYTIGVKGKSITVWWVDNKSKDRNKNIMQYLIQFPDTRPEQSDFKFFQYQLDKTAR